MDGKQSALSLLAAFKVNRKLKSRGALESRAPLTLSLKEILNMSQYPKWLYHKSEAAKIVQTKEEHDALIGRWEETPAAFDQEQVSAPKEQAKNKNESVQQESKAEEKLVIIKKKHAKGDK